MAAYGLTERERQVVGLLVLTGPATEQIVSRPFVSTSTVRQHLASIFDKVGELAPAATW